MNAQTPPVRIAEIDPRILRSRRMLHDALATLLKSKEFEKISIQDIAEASTLNRATFYDHYPDKFALLQCMVGTRFGELMEKRNVRIDDCESALRAIALGVCDYLAEAPIGTASSQQGGMQTAVVGVVKEMFLRGLHGATLARGLETDVVASTVSWAIYGAASAWMQRSVRCSAEQMAGIIDKIIAPMLLSAVPDHKPAAASAPGRRRLQKV